MCLIFFLHIGDGIRSRVLLHVTRMHYPLLHLDSLLDPLGDPCIPCPLFLDLIFFIEFFRTKHAPTRLQHDLILHLNALMLYNNF